MSKFREGKDAYYDGLEIDDCPYTGEDASAWSAGWAEAENDDPLKEDFE